MNCRTFEYSRVLKVHLDWLEGHLRRPEGSPWITDEERYNLALEGIASFGTTRGIYSDFLRRASIGSGEGKYENAGDGIFSQRGKLLFKTAFRGKFFLKHEEGYRMAHSYFNELISRTKVTKNHRGVESEIYPFSITRTDMAVNVISKVPLEEFVPNLSDEKLYVPFDYERKPIEVKNRRTGNKPIVTGVTYKFGRSWTLVIYDKVLQRMAIGDTETALLTEDFIRSAKVGKGEYLYRIELRAHTGEVNKFITAELRNNPPDEFKLYQLMFQRFYNSHKVRIKTGSRKDKSRLPEFEAWKNFFCVFSDTKFEVDDFLKIEKTSAEVYDDVLARLIGVVRRSKHGEGINKKSFDEAVLEAFKIVDKIESSNSSSSLGLKKHLLKKK